METGRPRTSDAFHQHVYLLTNSVYQFVFLLVHSHETKKGHLSEFIQAAGEIGDSGQAAIGVECEPKISHTKAWHSGRQL